jgi:hypothetical protein
MLEDTESKEEADASYKDALERRNKLLNADKQAVMHSAIKDQASDWFELENNVWESKENREFAKKCREFEEQQKFENEMATFVSIGGGDDLVTMKQGEVKSHDQISKEANQFINQLAMDKINQNVDKEDEEIIKENFKDIKIKSCQYLDERSRELMQKLWEDVVRVE